MPTYIKFLHNFMNGSLDYLLQKFITKPFRTKVEHLETDKLQGGAKVMDNP